MATIQASLKILLKDLSCFDDSFNNGVALQEAKFETVWPEVAGTTEGETAHETLLKIREELDESSAKLVRKRHQNSRHIEAQMENALKMCEQSPERSIAYPGRFSRMLCQHCVKFSNKAEEHAENVSAMCTQLLAFDPKKNSVAPLNTPEAPDMVDTSFMPLASVSTAGPSVKQQPKKKKKNSKQNTSNLNLSMMNSVTTATWATTDLMPPQGMTLGISPLPQRAPSMMTDDFFTRPRQLSMSDSVSATPISKFVAFRPAPPVHGAKSIVCPCSGRWRYNPYMC